MEKQRILLTGADGQLGYHLQAVFNDAELFLGTRENFDITNAKLVSQVTNEFAPDLILHAAAFTDVDGAETNREQATAVNVDGSRNVAKAAKACGATLVAIGTDYVFSGVNRTPYQENEQCSPQTFYGHTKYEGEQALKQTHDKLFLCRTSWLYGGPKPTPNTDFAHSKYKNFVLTMLRLAKERDTLEVVGDQIGSPTYANDIAQTIKELVKSSTYGTYHITNSGQTNWADFTKAIVELAGYQTQVTPISSQVWASRQPNAAKRPSYSVLGHEALKSAGVTLPRDWQAALADFLSEMQP